MRTSSSLIAAALSLFLCPTAFAGDGPNVPSGPNLPTDPSGVQSWQYLSSFKIAAAERSLDIDGDGESDQGIYDAMEVLQQRMLAPVYEAIDLQTDFPGQVDACESTEEGCRFNPNQGVALKQRYTALIETVVSIESIDYFVAQWVESADYPWAFSAGPNRAGMNLAFHGGELAEGVDESTFVWGYTMGRLVAEGAEVGQSGVLHFEGDSPLRVQLPAGPDAPGGAITLRSPVVEMSFDSAGVESGFLAAGLPVAEVAKMLEVWIRVLDAQGLFPDEIDVDVVVDEMTEAITDVADITCGPSLPCLSATFRFNSLPVDGIEVAPPEQPEVPETPEVPEIPNNGRFSR